MMRRRGAGAFSQSFSTIRPQYNNQSHWKKKKIFFRPVSSHLYIFVSAFLEVLALNDLQGLFSAARCRADWLSPSCLPRSGKRRMCVLAVMWVEPHPDALVAAGWCPPSSWWCCAQNLQRGTDAVWRYKRVALRGDIQERKKPIQSWHGYLTDIQFFMCVCVFF